MRLPQTWIVSLAGMLVGCGSSEPAPALDPATLPECHRTIAATLSAADLDAASKIIELLHTHDAVLLGEHHADVAEIDFLVSVLHKLERPTVLAMELLPHAAQADINRALVTETLSDQAWPGIVGFKYWPAPLHVAEYSRVLDAVRAARARGVDVQIVGLAPQCRLPPNPRPAQRDTAIRCFKERDDRMLDRLRQIRVDLPKHTILVSAGWRHVSATRLPGAPRAMGMDLPAHWSSARVLLAGTEQSAGEGQARATCSGAPAAIAEAVGRPVYLSASQPTWSLSTCVALEGESMRPLDASFDAVIGLPAGPPPTPWDRYTFARVPAEDRTAWTRTRTSLMAQSWPGGSPEELERWAAQDLAQVTAQQTGRSTGCDL